MSQMKSSETEFGVRLPDGRYASKHALRATNRPDDQYWTPLRDDARELCADLENAALALGALAFAPKVMRRVVTTTASDPVEDIPVLDPGAITLTVNPGGIGPAVVSVNDQAVGKIAPIASAMFGGYL